jgi:tetratricopeptide (TPR) repeat protein
MNKVKVYKKNITIPTYGIGNPDKNPMFYEKRVYQGSSGKVYPLPVIDKIFDNANDQDYEVVWLENDYIKVMIMPQFGGRIQRAYDKTNDYDFVYYNHVIKPALVGLAGPWISGGIEFNWPQHHRPTTFSPVDFRFEELEDGSATVWCHDIDKMYGTKSLTGFTLYPDKAYIEVHGQLYNPTDIPQTFLWWANPAVAVNDDTKSIFPPDVHAVLDHGKRDVSEFPIAKGIYYKVDYSPGTDISRYKNIPVPTSYMAYHSDYNFVGGYDFNKKAGILHIANHHISPGKKQWTWGNGDFGQAWDRHLTDNDGPYIELMTGVYTDNQPDFTWLQPYEEKRFVQYFMPYKHVGEVKNASIDLVVNLEFKETVNISVYATGKMTHLEVVLKKNGVVVFKESIIEITPLETKSFKVSLKDFLKNEIKLEIYDESGKILIDYQEKTVDQFDMPEPAKAAKKPNEIASLEDLYLTGLHLEQYRHATYRPDGYYLEGLKRDDSDIRLNNAYGLLLFRRGEYLESEKYFRKAKEKLLWKNPNPYDSEALYNLGLTLKMKEQYQEAYENFYKSVWNEAQQTKGYYQLASIDCLMCNYPDALDSINKCLEKGIRNLKARNLKSVVLRKLGRKEEALNIVIETGRIDSLDYGYQNEFYRITGDKCWRDKLIELTTDENNSFLELAIFYAESGFYTEAINVLEYVKSPNPLIHYYLGYMHGKLDHSDKTIYYYNQAEKTSSYLCFPNKLFTIKVLEDAIKLTPELSKAYYYLGMLYYDKLVHDKAIQLWETSRDLEVNFPTVYRNLGIAYFNKRNMPLEARRLYEKAYELDSSDSRVFYELDQLYKRTNVSLQHRKELIEANYEIMTQRDDFYIEYIQILNNLGFYMDALNLLLKRKFHVWEGGEGRVVEQYVFALKNLAMIEIRNSSYDKAIDFLTQAKIYPENLGEGKLINAQENDLNYYLGYCNECLKKTNEASKFYELAVIGTDELTAAIFYNDTKPDSIFYQGMALNKLDRIEEAKSRFKKMIDYGNTHSNDHVEVDYFAVSLPNFLIFNENLDLNNLINCQYLKALGEMGLHNINETKRILDSIQKNDVNHQGIIFMYKNFLI